MKAGPDGVRSWIVAVSILVIFMITAGIFRSQGVLFVAFMDSYNVDRKGAATPFAVNTIVRNVMAPIVGILGQKYGVSSVSIIGGFLSTVTASMCFFAPDLLWLVLIWGGLYGVASAFITVLPVIVIGQYFEKFGSTASGLALSGSCLGSLIFPAIFEKLLYMYGLEGTFLVIAGIIMHSIPCGMLLKKPPWMKQKKIQNNTKPAGKDFEGLEEFSNRKAAIDINVLHQRSDLVFNIFSMEILETRASNVTVTQQSTPDICRPQKGELIKGLESIFFQGSDLIDKNQFAWKTNDSFSLDEDLNEDICKKRQHESDLKFREYSKPFDHMKSNVPNVSQIYNELLRKEYILSKLRQICDSNDMRIASNLHQYNPSDIEEVLIVLRSLYNSYQNLGSEKPRKSNEDCKFVVDSKESITLSVDGQKASSASANTFKHHIKASFSIHKNVMFLLICMNRLVFMFSFDSIIPILVDFAMDVGLPEEDGKFLISALGFGDLVGRLGSGWITDRGFVGLARFMSVTTFVLGISTACVPFMISKPALLVASGLYGLLQGILIIRHPVLIAKYIRPEQQSIAVGCVDLLPTILILIVPLYIGFFRDQIGSYNPIFYINGILTAVAGIVWAFQPRLVKLFQNNEK